MDNLLGHARKTGLELCIEFIEHLKTMDVDVIHMEVRKVELAPEGFIIDGEMFTHLILATGSIPKKLDIPGALYYLEPERSVKGEELLIIGSGDLAFDNAVRASVSGISVTVLMRGEPRANESLFMEARSLGVKEIVGDEMEIGFDGEFYRFGSKKYDRVAVFIGRTPNRELTEHLGDLKVELPHFSTSIKGLYIVGDAALGTFSQTALASGSGLAAAMHIAQTVKKR